MVLNKTYIYSYKQTSNNMPTYATLFTYETLAVHGTDVVYSNVTLLSDLCGKKKDATVDEIRLDVRSGLFSFPRASRSKETAAAKTLVEFKGTHTRFSDEENSDAPDDQGVTWLGNDGFVLPSSVVTLKLYENKRKLVKPDCSIKQYIINGIMKALDGKPVGSTEATGQRGELLVTISTSEKIPMKTLTEFTVCTARNRSRTCFYSRVA